MNAAELVQLDALLDARLTALARRGEDGLVAFAVDERDAALDELMTLITLARGDERGMAVFDAGGAERREPGGAGRLARLQREFRAFVTRALRGVSRLAVVESGEEAARVRTRVGWTGDLETVVGPDVSAELLRAHASAVARALATTLLRVRLLTMMTSAAGKIAALLVTPGAAVMALPIAYRCVRDVYTQWRERGLGAELGETPWQ
ncbi:MAG: hypothetical protein H6713_20405 [Myxococcales bacterium]|nr:hypothetical protein [Myxococcales bacterium]